MKLLFCCSKNVVKNRRLWRGKKKFNMDPKKVSLYYIFVYINEKKEDFMVIDILLISYYYVMIDVMLSERLKALVYRAFLSFDILSCYIQCFCRLYT